VFDFLDGPVRELVTQIYEAVGYLGVAFWVAIESVIVPIPSEVILPFAGFLVGAGTAIEPITGAPWSFVLTVVAGTAGSLVGAWIAYAIGYFGGRPLILRWGRYLFFDEDDLHRTEAFFARYGVAASLIGRVVPVVRSLVSFAAGVGKMPLVPFTIYTIIGSAVWVTFLVSAGALLGASWEEITPWLKRYEYLILGLLAAAVIGFVAWKVRRRRAGRGARAADGPAAVIVADGPAAVASADGAATVAVAGETAVPAPGPSDVTAPGPSAADESPASS
jgi:membrane protein DedA with SNARE-associated domain